LRTTLGSRVFAPVAFWIIGMYVVGWKMRIDGFSTHAQIERQREMHAVSFALVHELNSKAGFCKCRAGTESAICYIPDVVSRCRKPGDVRHHTAASRGRKETNILQVLFPKPIPSARKLCSILVLECALPAVPYACSITNPSHRMHLPFVSAAHSRQLPLYAMTNKCGPNK
jgi:hypothetical protein